MSSPTLEADSTSAVQTTHYISAKQTIPFAYRAILLGIEPLFAVASAVFALRYPANYLATLTRESLALDKDHAFIYNLVGGGWLFFAFFGLFVFHMFDDRRLWRVLCVGMLLRDIPSLHGAAQGVGGWRAFLSIADWTSNDLLVVLMTVPPMIVRFLIVLGVGVEHPRAAATQEKKNE